MARPKRKPATDTEANGHMNRKMTKTDEQIEQTENAVDSRSRKRKIALVAPLPPASNKRDDKDKEDAPVQAKKSRETLVKRRSKGKKTVTKRDRARIITNREVTESQHCLTVPKVPSILNGEALAVGSGDVGQLGLGSDVLEKSRPFPVPDIPEAVVDIVAGGMHSVCLTASGKVYTFGCNDDGTLGRPTSEEEDCFVPGVVTLPEKVVKISAGDTHSAALTESGHVYIWGNFRDSNGLMGLTSSGRREPLPVQILPNVPCASLASGSEHLVCLTLDGQIYTMGNGEQGQLGRVSQYANNRGGRRGLDHILKPEAVHFRKTNNKDRHKPEFNEVWAGAYCTFARERTTGAIYGFGLNNYKQLGEGQLTLFMPTSLKILSGKEWKMVIGGTHHVVALDSNGQVYSWGRKDDGRLGLGDISNDQEEPTLVPTLKDVRCTHVSCGTSTSFAVTEEGQLYTWGFGETNQLGHGNDEDCTIPTLVESKAMKSRTVLKAQGGGQHTLILAVKKEEQTS